MARPDRRVACPAAPVRSGGPHRRGAAPGRGGLAPGRSARHRRDGGRQRFAGEQPMGQHGQHALLTSCSLKCKHGQHALLTSCSLKCKHGQHALLTTLTSLKCSSCSLSSNKDGRVLPHIPERTDCELMCYCLDVQTEAVCSSSGIAQHCSVLIFHLLTSPPHGC